nr:hypothetical protein [Caulobacter vibrioides]
MVDGADLDALDQAAHQFDDAAIVGRGLAVLQLGQALLQGADLFGVNLGRARVQGDRRLLVGAGQLGLDLGLIGLGRDQARAHRRRFGPVADRVDQARDSAVQFGQALFQRRAARLGGGGRRLILGMIGAHIGRDGRRRQHLGAQPLEHAVFDLVAHDAAPVVTGAGPLADIDRTDQAALALDRVVSAALDALEQA